MTAEVVGKLVSRMCSGRQLVPSSSPLHDPLNLGVNVRVLRLLLLESLQDGWQRRTWLMRLRKSNYCVRH
jgi:hypothetical protein